MLLYVADYLQVVFEKEGGNLLHPAVQWEKVQNPQPDILVALVKLTCVQSPQVEEVVRSETVMVICEC